MTEIETKYFWMNEAMKQIRHRSCSPIVFYKQIYVFLVHVGWLFDNVKNFQYSKFE